LTGNPVALPEVPPITTTAHLKDRLRRPLTLVCLTWRYRLRPPASESWWHT
jgi:hypothetical protein